MDQITTDQFMLTGMYGNDKITADQFMLTGM